MSLFSSLRESTAPPVAVEIAAGRVWAAAVEWRGGQPVVALHAIEPMPEGALVPSLTTTNTHDRSAVMTALNRVLDKMGRPRRISLAIPDVVAKVSLVRFEKVPPRQVDLEQLVRWQVRKSAPFPIEEAQVAYVPGIRADDGQEFIVALARRENINEYEQLCAEARGWTRWIRGRPPCSPIASRPLRRCSIRSRRSSDCCCAIAKRRWCRHDSVESVDAPVLQRTRRPVLAARARGPRGRSHGVQHLARAALFAQRYATGHAGDARREPRRRSASAGEPAARHRRSA